MLAPRVRARPSRKARHGVAATPQRCKPELPPKLLQPSKTRLEQRGEHAETRHHLRPGSGRVRRREASLASSGASGAFDVHFFSGSRPVEHMADWSRYLGASRGSGGPGPTSRKLGRCVRAHASTECSHDSVKGACFAEVKGIASKGPPPPPQKKKKKKQSDSLVRASCTPGTMRCAGRLFMRTFWQL